MNYLLLVLVFLEKYALAVNMVALFVYIFFTKTCGAVKVNRSLPELLGLLLVSPNIFVIGVCKHLTAML